MDGHAAQKVKAYALFEFIIVIFTKIYCQTNSIVNNKHVALNESVLNYICCFKSSPASSVEISDWCWLSSFSFPGFQPLSAKYGVRSTGKIILSMENRLEKDSIHQGPRSDMPRKNLLWLGASVFMSIPDPVVSLKYFEIFCPGVQPTRLELRQRCCPGHRLGGSLHWRPLSDILQAAFSPALSRPEPSNLIGRGLSRHCALIWRYHDDISALETQRKTRNSQRLFLYGIRELWTLL